MSGNQAESVCEYLDTIAGHLHYCSDVGNDSNDDNHSSTGRISNNAVASGNNYNHGKHKGRTVYGIRPVNKAHPLGAVGVGS